MIAEISERIEAVTLALLLPLFFALTGLQIRLDLLSGRYAWLCTLVIVATAILGKLAGTAVPARAAGRSWKDSIALGLLMNTRGLVELVLLNAGLEMGFLTPRLFTMMVIMTVFTTGMAIPILNLMKVIPTARSASSAKG